MSTTPEVLSISDEADLVLSMLVSYTRLGKAGVVEVALEWLAQSYASEHIALKNIIEAKLAGRDFVQTAKDAMDASAADRRLQN